MLNLVTWQQALQANGNAKQITIEQEPVGVGKNTLHRVLSVR